MNGKQSRMRRLAREYGLDLIDRGGKHLLIVCHEHNTVVGVFPRGSSTENGRGPRNVLAQIRRHAKEHHAHMP